MIIRIPLLFEGNKTEKHLYALFDSGAGYSCITPEAAAVLSTIIPLARPMQMGTAKEDVYLDVEYKAVLEFYHDDVRLSDEFLVVPGLSEEVIIGAYTMQKWHLQLDFKKNTVIVHPEAGRSFIRSVKPF